MARRKLRKAEATLVSVAVNASLERTRPFSEQIEREIVEGLLPSVPPELREHALMEFMNEQGREVFAGVDIARLLSGDYDEMPPDLFQA